ncbi:MAG TPA: alpha/beta fold hydrolase [Clostridia bacterium]|jgi:alpha-beta hydrolase superfamily lysophospholipase
MKREWFEASDQTKLSLAVWEIPNPKCIVQIIHGMNEHMGRYDEFARFLNNQGFLTAGDDHRGHGLTAGERAKVGKANDDIFEKTAQDQVEITQYLKNTYNLPVIVLGHSYGSFLAQKYMTMAAAKDVAGFILTGTGKLDMLSVFFGRLIAVLSNPEKDAVLVKKMTFEAYDKKLKGGPNSWLTHEQEIVDKYNSDEFIVPVFSYGFYRSFFKGLSRLWGKALKNIDKSTKVAILCGSQDGVGAWGKYPRALYKKYKKLGLKDAYLKIYDNMRHEILNESSRLEVYQDIAGFINQFLNA